MRENQEAFERIDMARADEAYMSDLLWNHLKLVSEELWVLELYKKGVGEAGPSGGGGRSTMRPERK